MALGASETYGVGATPHTQGYAYRLAQALHATHFLDVGIPGTTLDAGYETELTKALAARPSLCTVFFGVNDLRDGVKREPFLQNLYDLVSTLRQARARVLIVGVPDLSLVPAASGLPHLHATTVAWNSGMRRVARQTGAQFFDLSRFGAEMAKHPGYVAADGLHPSNAGHAKLAQVLLAAIRDGQMWRAP